MSKKIHQKEDEIDFKLIWFLIIESKRFIIIVTLAFSIATAIFLYFRPLWNIGPPAPPAYIASEKILIGSYKNKGMECLSETDIRDDLHGYRCKPQVDQYSTIHEFAELKELLKFTFPRVSDLRINYTNLGNYILLIDVYSSNQENTKKKLLEIITFVKNLHQLKIDEIKESRNDVYKSYKDQYDLMLLNLNNKIIELEALKDILIEKLNLLNNRIDSINNPLSEVEKKINESEIILTKYHLEDVEIELSTLAHTIKNSTIFEIHGSKLQALYQLSKDSQELLSENFYRNSKIVNDITTDNGLTTEIETITTEKIDYREKNIKIMLKNFFTGLILSLLVVLFRSRKKIF